ncbi:MAG: transcription antitermination factor NusB [Clostridiales bacterium]|nr:transcription antitermination factor NusB [Candidatus Equinaster intestinalis]
MLKRKESRENAFLLIFEKSFNDLSIDDILELAVQYRDFEYDEFCESVFRGVFDNLSEIDAVIEENSKGWKVERIGKVALSVLRLAIYEIKYREDIPVSVSANEAVELCKKYALEEDASFVNGILGTVARAQGNA